MRAEEFIPIEMNHVVWLFGDPDFLFPSQRWEELPELGLVLEGSDEHEARSAILETFLKIDLSKWIDGPKAMNGLNQVDPVLFLRIGDNIRKPAMTQLEKPEFTQSFTVDL